MISSYQSIRAFIVSARISLRLSIVAIFGVGLSGFSSMILAQVPPAPTGVSATTQSEDAIVVRWNGGSGGGITGWNVFRCAGASCSNFTQIGQVSPWNSSPAYTDSGLYTTTAYSYKITAVNSSGQSPYSSIASATTQAYSAPSGLTGSVVSGTSVYLFWTPSSSTGTTGYNVQQCQGSGCSNFTGFAGGWPTNGILVNGLTPQTVNQFRVQAIDAGGNASAYSNVFAISTPQVNTQPPSAPTNLSATAASSTQVNLSWTASTDPISVTGYLIYRCTGAGCTSFSQVGSLTGYTGVATRYNDTTVAPVTTYQYRVQATDGSGLTSGYSNTASVTTPQTPPSAPTNLTATPISSAQVNLSWTASTGPNGVASYFIEQCSGAGCTTFAQIASTAATSYSVTGLVATTSYSYRVRATDSSGNIGPYSTVVSASTTAVNAPSSLTATASSSLKIALGWTASTDPAVNSYLIERCAGSGCTSFSQVATSPTASYNDTSLASATTYQYRVRAQDTAGNTSAYSNTASATTLAVAPPSGLTATVQSSDSIKLSWSASSDPALSAYLIERCSGQSCSAFAQVASATTTTYTDATLLALTPYSYRVRATDANGNMSTYTSVVSGTTQGVGAPGTLTTTAQSSSQVNLSWGASNDSALASYRVQRCSESACTNFVQIASTTTTTYSDMGLTFGTLYRYRVYAIDTAGNASPYTNIAAVTTPYPTNTQPPSTPTNLTATAASNTQIDLSWTASTDLIAVTNYLVQRCAGSGCSNFVQIGTSTVASYSDSGLVANSTYCYRVQATDAAGNLSGFSNVVTAATGTGAQTYTYDSGGHLKTITTSGGTTFTYSYDAAGNLTGIQRSP